MYYYVYETTNIINGMIYIGYHSTNNLNDGYKGSGIELKKAFKEFGKFNFNTKILKMFNNRKSMKKYEARLVTEDFKNRPDTYNKILGGGGIERIKSINSGKVVAKDKSGSTFRVNKSDPRYLSGELVGIATGNISKNKGKLTVKDKSGKTTMVSTNDQRYLSGELVHITKGKVTVKDKSGKTMQINKNDPRYLSGELVSINKNMATVKDKSGKIFQVNKNDPRFKTGEISHVTSGQITIKDNVGNIFNVYKNDPRYLSGELVSINKNMITILDKFGTKMRIDKNNIEYKKDIEQFLLQRKLHRNEMNRIYKNNRRK